MMDLDKLYGQAVAAQKSGNFVEAELRYREILGTAAIPEVMVNHANVLAMMNHREEALAGYNRALAAKPNLFEGLFNRGNLLLEMKQADAALASFDAALAVRQDMAGVWNNRGTALRDLRRQDAALVSYDRALTLAPGHFNALTNRAITLLEMRRLDEALAAVDAALALQPAFAEALYVRGNILRDLGRMTEALTSHEKALEANPAHPYALNGMVQAALNLCDWKRTAALAPRLKEGIETGRALIQPFVLLGYSDDPALQRRCAENYVRRTVPRQAPLSDGRRYGHDKIRLAYLSADFHQHPTAQLMVELFEKHDRSRFEVTAIAFGPDDNSAMRTRLKQAFDRFEDVRGQSDADVARMLRGRETDIVIDLNGHTQGARPGIFAHRPAPVAVNYLVYPGTTGADYMDVILADAIVAPASQQEFFREKIVHLPGCYQANDGTRLVHAAPSRAACGLPEGGIVFCCFNNNWKITAPVFDIWMRLLTAVPGSVLWLLDGPGKDNLRKEAAARGVDASRLIFAPHAVPDAHLARHQCADLFLDTLPYNAHTTASDALYAGVPLVTEVGQVFQSRVAASLLNALDMGELVTTSANAYEALALELASNPALLKATREKLARNLKTAPFYDGARFVKNIEAAYAAMLD
jgi:predicted O-linked N-acetylglucosamine transferase (SPINDLY family)